MPALAWGGCGSQTPLLPGGGLPFSDPDSTTGSDEDSGTSGIADDASQESGYCEPIGNPGSGTQKDMLDEINRYRTSQGRAALLYSKTLESAAEDHARDMAARDFFDHTNPDGDGPLERAQHAGFCSPRLVGENIAWGQGALTTPAEVQDGWEDSPGHNANMLKEDFVFVGMAHYVTPDAKHFWVQVFGTPQF